MINSLQPTIVRPNYMLDNTVFKAKGLPQTREACFNNADQVCFEGNSENSYENPINRGWEKTFAVAKSLVGSSIFGLVGSAVALGLKAKTPVAIIAGLATAAVSAILTVPGAYYDASVNSFVKDKEMDVFSRVKSVETNLSEQIDNFANNPDHSLDESINQYFKFNVGRKGNGVGFATIA